MRRRRSGDDIIDVEARNALSRIAHLAWEGKLKGIDSEPMFSDARRFMEDTLNSGDSMISELGAATSFVKEVLEPQSALQHLL